MTIPSNPELAWAVGLFEGEGCISFQKAGGGGPWPSVSAYMVLQMTDEDAVRTFHRIVGVGNVNGPYFPKSYRNSIHKKPFWRWAIAGYKAEELIKQFLPFLHSRRACRGMEVLDGMQRWRTRPRTPRKRTSLGRYTLE